MASRGHGRRSGEARSPLRVGVLVDSLVQPAWVARIIEDIQHSAVADIVLVVLNESPDLEVSLLGRIKKVVNRPDLLLYWCYQSADEFLFGRSSSGTKARVEASGEPRGFAPFTATDIGVLLQDSPRMIVQPIQTRFSDYFPEDRLQEILSHDLDVALRFGFRILRGGALNIARYGVWSYHHADNTTNRGGPAGFWEVFEQRPVTGSVLQILTEDLDNGIVLYRSFTGTDKYSVARNRSNYFSTASAFVMRTLRDLYELGPTTLALDSAPRYQPYCNRLYTRARNPEMARLLAGHGLRVVRDRIRHHLTPEQWMLAYRLSSEVPSLHRFKYLIPPPDRFWADPFPVARHGRYYIFFEEAISARGKAHISLIEISQDGSVSEPVEILEREYHLSYPYVFEWQGQYYMIPETTEMERVELYRCVEFPHRWEFERVLIDDVRAVDASVVELSGRWWMFVNIAVPGAREFDELHLYSSNDPRGPWEPHRRNPVKSDARSSRPAGRPFEWNGRLLRPAQDCGTRYGYAISINEVSRIDDECFEEREISRIEPNWDPRIVATHTLNSVPGLTVVDGLRMRSRFRDRQSE